MGYLMLKQFLAAVASLFVSVPLSIGIAYVTDMPTAFDALVGFAIGNVFTLAAMAIVASWE